MPELDATRTCDASTELGPTVPELLSIAADVVAMVDGHVLSATVGHGLVSVHVTCQSAAEYLAWRLALEQVTVFEPTRTCHGFAVWRGGAWPEAEYKVFCGGDLVPPLRTFPRSERPAAADTTAAAKAA